MKIANINMQEGAGESCCKSNRQFSYFRLPLRIQMYATFFSILFATLGLVSCSTPSRNLSFSNSNEAIEECRAFRLPRYGQRSSPWLRAAAGSGAGAL